MAAKAKKEPQPKPAKDGYTLIITEKPNASKRIAESIADKAPKKLSDNGVPYYELTAGGKPVVVACAVGHLYGLAEKDKTKGFKYPVFDIEWVPISEVQKGSAFSKKYLNVIKKLAKGASDFIIATDFDIEGEVIGYNILKYACGAKDAKRMKYSALTKPDLVESYQHLLPTIEWGMVKAGEARHILDWYYGINISRALSSSIKKAGRFQIVSAGRVQGPALKIVVDREKEIKAFKPEPFWQITLIAIKQKDIEALHETEKFWKQDEAEKIFAKVKGKKEATVKSVEKKQQQQAPPHPFDLTSLQLESARCLRLSPKKTLELAQDLYSNGFISYPRTSSQQLPPNIGYKKILNDLKRQEEFAKEADIVLASPLKPNDGKKTDPAHPAIYPTGIAPEGIDPKTMDLYRLVVRRFLATFGEPAVRETMTIIFDVNGEAFIAKGTRTVAANWHILYGKFVKMEEEELPGVTQGEKVKVKSIDLAQKETQPPGRYSDASLVKELEKRNLGTKATRAAVIDTLQQRKYIQGKKLEATNLGMHLVEVLEKYSPEMVDEAMTRHFEEDMDLIHEGKKKEDEVLGEARKVLDGILTQFKKHEKDVGEGLLETFQETQTVMNTLGKCPNCEKGTLMMRRGKFGKFAACDSYPDCKTTFSLPRDGLVNATEKVCEHCKFPILQIIRAGKKPQELCPNPNCPSKAVELPTEVRTCPKCGKGKIIARKSVYGPFLACDQFPKCRYTERIKRKEDAAETVPPM
ncbi:MAG TPA: DNA topoisomerase I [Candidatus Nanoarchaeia archaeon]|nr:DNA topoisomerase I [Candidatus Nanoarchaeia archaeon]